MCQDDVIRITHTTASTIPAKMSLSVSATWGTPSFCVTEAGGVLDDRHGAHEGQGHRVEQRASSPTRGLDGYQGSSSRRAPASLKAATIEGVATNTVQAAFSSPASEALFGLGQHQDGVINRKGSTPHMLNANTQIQIPVLVLQQRLRISSGTTTRPPTSPGTPRATRSTASAPRRAIWSTTISFYGPTIDRVIANYRTTTGAAPLFPKWAYGLFQSKDHYQSSSELLSVEQGYRKNNIPLRRHRPGLVQYWSPYVWGSQLMDPEAAIPTRPGW